MDADLVIARLAAAQHGVVGRKQLLSAGVPPHVIDHRLARDRLVAVHAGVYRVASAPVLPRLRIMAATLAGGPSAVASHRAAAFMHGLAGIEFRVEVSVIHTRAPHPAGVVIHRLRALSLTDVETRDSIPRTRPPATIVGLAAVVPVARLEVALDDALVRGLVSCALVQRRLDAAGHRGRPGAASLARLLAVRQGAQRWTQSEFERRLLGLFRQARLPLAIPQSEVVLPGGRRAFLDYAWPDMRLALEADSYRHHGGRLAWARDHTRNAVLVSLGWRILPVTWGDMVETPDELIELLRRAHAA